MAQGKKKKGKSARKASPKAKLHRRKRKAQRKPASSKRRGSRAALVETRGIETVPLSAIKPKARTAAVGGGAGDYEGVSSEEAADAESPRELLEEGQTFESEAIAGVENAEDPDRSEVKTREVPEDDVPSEYNDTDRS